MWMLRHRIGAMPLVPPDWEPLGESVGPFGPDELEVREYQESPSQPLRRWQVRIAARPDVVSIGRVSARHEPLGLSRRTTSSGPSCSVSERSSPAVSRRRREAFLRRSFSDYLGGFGAQISSLFE
jgi:hypothetical protein